MTGGFFYTLGYITAKIENLGNAANFKSPTNNFSKNLLEGSNLARKEFEQSKSNMSSSLGYDLMLAQNNYNYNQRNSGPPLP